MKWGLPISFSILFWGIVGFLRFSEEKTRTYKKKRENVLYKDKKALQKKIQSVAVVISARNEAAVIQRTFNSIKRLVPMSQCFVLSDGSTDTTAQIALENGCSVISTVEPVGKARGLSMLLKIFNILDRFKYVLFVDGDTRIGKDYLKNAFSVFENPKIACIAAHAQNQWRNERKFHFSWKHLIIAYRARLYSFLQMLYVYPQTWNSANATLVVPGFASIYRSDVLRKLRIDVPGLVIEDFNLAFQIRKKKLGLIGYSSDIYGKAYDPTILSDYIRQIGRWNMGFFQTIRKYGIWLSFFWASLGVFITEVFFTSFSFIILPVLVFASMTLNNFNFGNPFLKDAGLYLDSLFFVDWRFLLGIFAIDYLITILVAAKDSRPLILVYGLGFFILRYIDVFVLLLTAPRGLFVKSGGTWISPTRKV